MKIVISLNIEDYVYQFYKQGADTLGRRTEDLMEQALFIYAGMAARDMNRRAAEDKDNPV